MNAGGTTLSRSVRVQCIHLPREDIKGKQGLIWSMSTQYSASKSTTSRKEETHEKNIHSLSRSRGGGERSTLELRHPTRADAHAATHRPRPAAGSHFSARRDASDAAHFARCTADQRRHRGC